MFAMVKPNPEDVIAQFERWAAQRPIAPKKRRPRSKVRTMHPGMIRLLFYLAIMVASIVIAYGSTAALFLNTTELVVSALVAFAATVLGPSAWVIVSNTAHNAHYRRRMETTGWHLYDIKFETWQSMFDYIDPYHVVDSTLRKKYIALRYKGY